MNLKLKINKWLLIIVLLFLATRLYKITEIPATLYWDEASIGYNAYSILKTGRDEWGQFLPVHFRAFGEFKLPVYIYSTVPFIVLFGLSEIAIRLPAVLFSLGVVVLTYLLASKIFDKRIGLLASFMVTITPWFFIFSRTGYEATAGLMFYLLGIYLFLSSDKRRIFILISVVSFILSMYSHNSFRILVPLTILIVYFFFLKHNLKAGLRFILISIIAAILFIFSLVPIARLIIYDSGFNRIQGISVIPIIRWVTSPNGQAEFQIIKPPSENYLQFLQNYLAHLNPSFLFISGDKNIRSQQPGFGQLFIVDAIFLLLGLVFIIKSKKKEYFLPLIFLAITPLPASLTRESPHALRTLAAAPFLAIISAAGIMFLISVFPKKRILIPTVIIIYLIFFSNYLRIFYTKYNQLASAHWQYGYNQIYANFLADFKNYQNVVITDQYAQPYIFYLYFSKMDPTIFRSLVKYESADRIGLSTVKAVGNVNFKKIDLKEIPSGNDLIFSSTYDKLINVSTKAVLTNLDGSDSIYVYEVYK